MATPRRRPWYFSTPVLLVAALLCFPPILLVFIWRKPWSENKRIILSAPVAIWSALWLIIVIGSANKPAPPAVITAAPTTVAVVQATSTLVPTVPAPTAVRPTQTVPPAPTAPATIAVAEAPRPAVVPSYEWVSIERTSLPSRPRFRATIIMSQDYSDDQLLSVFRDAVNRAFREQPSAKAVVVFGHSSRDAISKGADLGSAWASSDRQGWAGDGKFDADRDDGKIYVNIGSSFTTRPASRRAIDR